MSLFETSFYSFVVLERDSKGIGQGSVRAMASRYIFCVTAKTLNKWLLLSDYLTITRFFCSYFCMWTVWNDKKSTQKDKTLKTNSYRLYFEEISVHLSKITNHCKFCSLSPAILVHRLGSNFLLPTDFTRFSKVSTRNIFTLFQP